MLVVPVDEVANDVVLIVAAVVVAVAEVVSVEFTGINAVAFRSSQSMTWFV